MIMGDFLPYAITLDDLSRLAAIYLWRNVNSANLVYGAGIEASLRVVKPSRHHPATDPLWKESIDIYNEAIEKGVPEQDARYVIPEGAQTRMILSLPPRYIVKVGNSLRHAPLPELKEIGEKFKEIAEREFGISSEENVPSKWEFFGSMKDGGEKVDINFSKTSAGKVDPYSVSMDMDINGSLAMYAQLVRQRQNLCEIEPLENIAMKGRFVVPPTFPEEITNKYKELAKRAQELQMGMAESCQIKDPNFAYLLLLGQEANARLYGKGYGVIETSKERSEGVAQWEIRSRVGVPLTRELAKHPELKGEIGPMCYREKVCKEPATFKTKKAICPSFEKTAGKWEGNLEELLDLLDESSRISVFSAN
jgi:hypothetical protein